MSKVQSVDDLAGVVSSNQGAPWANLSETENGIDLRLVSAKQYEGVVRVYFDRNREEVVSVRKGNIGNVRPYVFRAGNVYEATTWVQVAPSFRVWAYDVDVLPHKTSMVSGIVLMGYHVFPGEPVRLYFSPMRNVEIESMVSLGTIKFMRREWEAEVEEDYDPPHEDDDPETVEDEPEAPDIEDEDIESDAS